MPKSRHNCLGRRGQRGYAGHTVNLVQIVSFNCAFILLTVSHESSDFNGQMSLLWAFFSLVFAIKNVIRDEHYIDKNNVLYGKKQKSPPCLYNLGSPG